MSSNFNNSSTQANQSLVTEAISYKLEHSVASNITLTNYTDPTTTESKVIVTLLAKDGTQVGDPVEFSTTGISAVTFDGTNLNFVRSDGTTKSCNISAVLTSAKDYTDTEITAEVANRNTAIESAKSEAISTAANDATTKANQALTDAKAYTFSQTEITSKDSTVLSSAEGYTDAEIQKLDITVTGSAATKTIATLTETDGKIAATFQDISISESQVANLTTDLTTINTNMANKVDKVTGSSLVEDVKITGYDSHLANIDNPHGVTKAQIGLGNVTNTGDSAVPTEGGTTKFTTGGAYTELNKKQNKLTAGTNITIVGDTISATGSSGVSSFNDLTDRPSYNNTVMTSSTNIPEVKTSTWDGKQDALTATQLNAVNSGIDSTKVATYDGYAVGKQDVLVAGDGIKFEDGTVVDVIKADFDNSDAGKAVANKQYVNTQIAGKQDTLTANSGILISNNVISADTTVLATQTDLSAKENTSNKVTSISSSSTDTQYPSAKCVYDNIQSVRETAEGKNKAWGLKFGDAYTVLKYKKSEGVYDAYTEAQLNTLDSLSVVISQSTFIDDKNTVYSDLSSARKGDVIYFTNLNIPDFWIGNNASGELTLYRLETAKVDLTNYATTTALNTGLAAKQDTLTNGTGIDITGNTVGLKVATSSEIGGISGNGTSNLYSVDSSGKLAAQTASTYSVYEAAEVSAFISKGTLETVIEGKNLATLPTAVNDKYLHTNSSTGALEWSTVASGDNIFWATYGSSSYTDIQTAFNANKLVLAKQQLTTGNYVIYLLDKFIDNKFYFTSIAGYSPDNSIHQGSVSSNNTWTDALVGYRSYYKHKTLLVGTTNTSTAVTLGFTVVNADASAFAISTGSRWPAIINDNYGGVPSILSIGGTQYYVLLTGITLNASTSTASITIYAYGQSGLSDSYTFTITTLSDSVSLVKN